MIILERYYFLIKLLWRNCEINIPDLVSINEIVIKHLQTAAYVKCNQNIYYKPTKIRP